MLKHTPDKDIDRLFSSIMRTYDYLLNQKTIVDSLFKSAQVVELYQRAGYPDCSKQYLDSATDPTVNQPELPLGPTELFTSDQWINSLSEELQRLSAQSASASDEQCLNLVVRLTRLRSWFGEHYSRTAFNKSVSELWRETVLGNIESLILLLEIDPIFLMSDAGRQLFLISAFSHNFVTLRKISNALDPFRSPRAMKRKRDRYALGLIIQFGVERRKLSAWADMFAKEGFENYADEKTLSKALARLIGGKDQAN